MHANPYALLGGGLEGTLPNPTVKGGEAGLQIASKVFAPRVASSPSSSSSAVDEAGLAIGHRVFAPRFSSSFAGQLDLNDAIDDRVSALIVAGSNITKTYNDAANTLTLAAVVGTTGGTAPVSVDTIPASPHVMDEEGEGTVLDAKWTWVNQGTSTATFANGCLIMAPQQSATQNVRAIYQTVAGAFKWRVKFAIAATASFNRGGIALKNSGGNKLLEFGLFHNTTSDFHLYVNEDNSTTSTSSTAFNTGTLPGFGLHSQFAYIEAEYDSTNIKFRYSLTGVEGTFVQVYTALAATFLGTPDQLGLYADCFGTTSGLAIFDWARRV